MKLYDVTLSGHAHRARLFLGLLDLAYDLVPVDLAAGDHKKPPFLSLNPFGQVPVLDDDGVIIPDSIAILVYLATKYRRTDWLPEDAIGAARVQRWLSVAAGQIAFGPCAARLVTLFGAPFNHAEVIARAHAILRLVEQALTDQDWLAADHATLADVALYSYIARAPEGDVDLSPYPHIHTWLARVESLPGFVPFQETDRDSTLA
jgi:glutathione S-transferase